MKGQIRLIGEPNMLAKLTTYLDNLTECDEELTSALNELMNKKCLKMHTNSIWIDSKNRYSTKLGGKKTTASTLDGLNQKIINFYKNSSLSFYDVMISELDNRLKLRYIEQGTYDRYIMYYNRYIKGSLLEKSNVADTTEARIITFLESRIADGISKKNFSNLIGLLNIVYFYSSYNSIDVSRVKKTMNLRPKQFTKSNRRNTADVVWLDEEIDKLVNYANEHNDIRIYGMIFMLQTGLAISELVGLQKRDVDINAKQLSVRRIEKKFKENGKTVYTISEENCAKTETRLQSILLTTAAIDTFKKILKLSAAKKNTDFIFDGYHSYSFDSFLRRHVLIDLNLSKRGLHSFRKTYGTKLVDGGASPSLTSRQMRHSDIQTTIKHYYKNRHTKADDLSILESII